MGLDDPLHAVDRLVRYGISVLGFTLIIVSALTFNAFDKAFQACFRGRISLDDADDELLPEEEFADVEEALLPHPAIIAAQRTPAITVAANLFFI